MFPAEPNFGVDLANVLTVPDAVFLNVTVSFGVLQDRCRELGCPVLDPRVEAERSFDIFVPLQTGQSYHPL